jgi:uncharacterized membrane protein
MFRSSGVWCAGLLAAAALAFWPSYLSRPFGPVDVYTHVHAVAMATWCALLVVQPSLIRFGHRRLHRALGKVSFLLAPAIVVVGFLLVHLRMRSLPRTDLDGAAFGFYLPLAFITLFAACYALAMGYRRRPALHAAFMLGTGLSFIDPVLSRIIAFYGPPLGPDWYPVITFTTIDLLIAVIVYRARAPALGFLVGGFAVVELGWFVVARSDGWLRFAVWYRDLPLT